MRFVDTNILLYAASTAPEEQAKSQAALSLLEAEDLAVSKNQRAMKSRSRSPYPRCSFISQ
jgi:predicted nucleic acid-binding protein